MRLECRERFSRHSGLAIPRCIKARAWRTCRDACRDVPGIPGACATSNFTYLVRSPREAVLVSITTVQSMLCANAMAYYGPKVRFTCVKITPLQYHSFAVFSVVSAKNISRPTSHINAPWPYPKQCLAIHISHLMKTKRLSTIFAQYMDLWKAC